MILEFSQVGSGVKLLFGIGLVDGVRKLSVAAPMNNYIFESINDLKNYKRFNPGQVAELEDTNNVLAQFDNDEAAAKYVRIEMAKLDFEFLGELSVKDYAKKYGFRKWKDGFRW